jgi:hypothetical protein
LQFVLWIIFHDYILLFFFRCFSLFIVFSGTSFFSAAIEHIFSDHPIEVEKYSVPRNEANPANSGATTNYH